MDQRLRVGKGNFGRRQSGIIDYKEIVKITAE